MLASLGASDSEPASPGLTRGRGMTEGASELQIKRLNSNTQGMIAQKVQKLQKQGSIVRQPSIICPDLPQLTLTHAYSTSSGQEESKKAVIKRSELRRATSYCQP